MNKQWPDENAPLGLDLPDGQFVATRAAILELLPRLCKQESLRYTDRAVLEHVIDETVTDIGNIWKEHYESNRT